MDHADAALSTKASGRNCLRTFQKIYPGCAKTYRAESRLRNLLSVMNCLFTTTSDITPINYRCEALIRWQQPTEGFTSPGQLLPSLKKQVLLRYRCVILRETCRQVRNGWMQVCPLVLSVNISPIQLRHNAWLVSLQMYVKDTEFPAHCLELELTESSLMEYQKKPDLLWRIYVN